MASFQPTTGMVLTVASDGCLPVAVWSNMRQSMASCCCCCMVQQALILAGVRTPCTSEVYKGCMGTSRECSFGSHLSRGRAWGDPESVRLAHISWEGGVAKGGCPDPHRRPKGLATLLPWVLADTPERGRMPTDGSERAGCEGHPLIKSPPSGWPRVRISLYLCCFDKYYISLVVCIVCCIYVICFIVDKCYVSCLNLMCLSVSSPNLRATQNWTPRRLLMGDDLPEDTVPSRSAQGPRLVYIYIYIYI